MFLKLTIKLAQGLLNTRLSLFIAARDSKRILKGQSVLKDRPIMLLFCILYIETFNFIYVCGKQDMYEIHVAGNIWLNG